MAFQARKTSPLQTSVLPVQAPLLRKQQARRGLLIYFLLLIPLSALFGGQMWTPALASLVTRFVLREGFEDITFSLRGRKVLRNIGLAVLIPLGVAIIAYGSAWLVHLASLQQFHASGSLLAFLSLAGKPTPLLHAGLLVLFLTFIELLAATGEEIGWRGYMLTRLIDARVPKPILISGLIWSLWHWPIILLSPQIAGMPRVVTAGIFILTITSLGCISARLRLETGSIWPSIFLHAAWNAWIVEVFDALTYRPDTSFWIGESGILVALTTFVVAFIFSRGNWRRMRTPGETL